MSNFVDFFSETTYQKLFIYHGLLHFINRSVTTTVPLGTFIMEDLQERLLDKYGTTPYLKL